MRVLSTVLALVVLSVTAGHLSAADEKKPAGPEQRPGGGRGMMMRTSVIDQILAVKDMKLTDDQKAKLEKLKAEYASKLKGINAVLTEDQKKARTEAMKAAKKADKKSREIEKAGRDAVKLTDEQQEQLKTIQEEMRPIARELREKALKILTDEQKELLQKARPNRKSGEGRSKDGGK